MKFRYLLYGMFFWSVHITHTVVAQTHYIRVYTKFDNCNGGTDCSGVLIFNDKRVELSNMENNNYTEFIFETENAIETYELYYDLSCDSPECFREGTETGDMPDTHRGKVTFDSNSFYGSGYFTYCLEEDLPALNVSQGYQSDYGCGENFFKVNMPSWGTRYIFQASIDAQYWKDIDTVSTTGTSYLSASSTRVTGEKLEAFYGSVYGKTFYFRVWVKTCTAERVSAASEGVSFTAPAPDLEISEYTDVACHGQANGTATVNITPDDTLLNRFYIIANYPDAPQYSFSVDTAYVGDNKIEGLRAGDWEFVVVNNTKIVVDEDTISLGNCSDTILHTVNEPEAVTVSFQRTQHNGYDVSCSGGNNGQVTAVGAGGTGTYNTYTWTSGSTTVGNNATLTNRTAGTYSVEVNDSHSCVGTGSIVLYQPDALSAQLNVTSSHAGYDVSCLDASDGALAVQNLTGGVADYTYAWTNADVTTSAASGLVAGTEYEVTITDANSCEVSYSKTLTAPQAIDFTIAQTGTLVCPGDATVSFSVASTSITHAIGSVSYLWSSGETTNNITGKGAGTYSVTVTDTQGCSTSHDTGTLDDPEPYTLTLSASTNYHGSMIQCNGNANGGIQAVVTPPTGETSTITNYAWTKGDESVSAGQNVTAISHLDAGQYTLVVSYRSYCTVEESFTLTEPDALEVSVTSLRTTQYNNQDISCYNATDGSIAAAVSGGTGGAAAYTYQWDDDNLSTTDTLTGLGADTYNVQVTDANGCTATAQITLANPTPVNASLRLSDYNGFGVSCNASANGSIEATPEGGTGTYTYAWSNGANTATISDLGAGTYTLTIADSNHCSNTVQEIITQPAALLLSVQEQQNIACFDGDDGSITLAASGGVNDYQYSIDNSITWQTEDLFERLMAGNYNLTLKDINNCTTTTSATLTQPPIIVINFTGVADALCTESIGSATAVVTGGVPDYTYRWENSRAEVIGTEPLLNNVWADIYTLTIEDTHGCTMTRDVVITSTDGAQVTYTATDTRCFNTADGTATLTITDGVSPYTQQWPDGQTGTQATGLPKGNYNVLITDAEGCVVVKPVTISGPESIQMAIVNQTQPSCYGTCDGIVTINATGGATGYTYSWNNSTGATQTGLCKGAYPVVITDANSCILNDAVTLAQPDPLTLSLTNTTLATCRDGCDGILQVQATGGNAGYQYTWAGGGNASIQSGLCPGDYTATVVDQKNCQRQQTFTLPNTPAIPINLGGGVTLCVGQTYDLDAGEGWTSITWGSNTQFSSTDQQITISDPGVYWLEAYNANGCVGQDTFLMETSLDLLQASFLIPKDGYTSDTIVVVDISWPFPETTNWRYPTQMEVLSNTGEVLLGTFSDPGIYTLGLTVYLGECIDDLSKSITILRKLVTDNSNGKLGYEAFVKDVTLYPNPNKGAFEVGVEMIACGNILLSVWNASTGVMLTKVQGSDQDIYLVPFDLRPLSAGTYLLRLDYENGKKYLRFIVR